MIDPDQSFTLDVEDMTLGELEDLEECADVTIGDLQAGNLPMKAIRVLVWIVARRDDPAATVDDFRDVRLSQIVWAGDEGTDPKD